jgi:peptidoglycan/xylan/chitin deacetylase (PgdA/CDA1 family)
MPRSDRPLAVLTYHRIVQDPAAPRFHDVPLGTFEEQVAWLAERVKRVAEGLLELEGGRLVCLTFDDGTADHRLAGELLAAQGLCGTFFVVAGRLGTEGRLGAADVAALAREGHRIGSHCMSHRPLTRLQPSEVETELHESRRILEACVERPVDWLAPPGGYCSRTCLRSAERAGYRVVRTMEWGYSTLPPHGRTPCLPVLPDYDLPAFVRLIEGGARLLPYHLKNWLKRGLGAHAYTRLRDAGASWLRRRRSD